MKSFKNIWVGISLLIIGFILLVAICFISQIDTVEAYKERKVDSPIAYFETGGTRSFFHELEFPVGTTVATGSAGWRKLLLDFDVAAGWTYTDPNLVCVTDTTDIVGIGTAAPTAKTDIHPHAAGIIGLNIDAYTGYTANFVRLRDPNDGNLVTIDKDGDIATAATISANSAVLTGDTNTFNITSGTGSLDVAAGKTADIDMDLTINGTGTTITGADQANTITLNESLTVGGGADFTLTAEDTAGTITLDEQTFEVEGQGDNSQLTKIINVNDAAATISIEGTGAIVNQDTTSDGSPSFAKVTSTEIEYAGNITLDPTLGSASYVNIANSGAGSAKLYIEGAQVDSDDLSDVASIGMLDEAETVAGAWIFTDSTSAITIGDGTDAVDYRILANGHFADGSITYMEDEDRWDFTEGIKLEGASAFGGWGYTGEHVALTDGSSNTNAGLGEYFEISSSITAGKVMAAEYSRLMCRTAQTNQSTLVGTESQFRLYGVNLADGVHAGLWAVAEQSGASVLSGGGTFDAISATIESASGFEAGATEHVTGITVDSSINAGATIDASTNFSGIYIKSNGKDWYDGIHITGATNDIKLKNGATINNTSADLLTITEVTVDVDGALTAGTVTSDGDITATGANGSLCTIKSITEEVTIPVGSGADPNVDTSGNLAPAGSVIVGLSFRVTDAPGGGATELDIGITGGGDLDDFIDGASCDILGETGDNYTNGDSDHIGFVRNASATTLTLTTDSDVTGDEMKVRIVVFYYDLTAPTS